MKKVYINNIKDYIFIDDDDYNSVNKYRWHINKNYGTTRALTSINGKKIALPYFITGIENAYQKIKNLDFRKQNIGIDQHKYRYRKPQRNASSQYKGVRRMKMNSGNYTWISTISVDNERIHLGSFQSEEKAAEVYNQAVVEYWNGNGYLNDVFSNKGGNSNE